MAGRVGNSSATLLSFAHCQFWMVPRTGVSLILVQVIRATKRVKPNRDQKFEAQAWML
jgi:hypothetical protein